jgi:hypothetical protein
VSLALREIQRELPLHLDKYIIEPSVVCSQLCIFVDGVETFFPLCTLLEETITGLDHLPLIMTSVVDLRNRSPHFSSRRPGFNN